MKTINKNNLFIAIDEEKAICISYESLIATYDFAFGFGKKADKCHYSRTTSKHFNEFLRLIGKTEDDFKLSENLHL